MNASWQIKMLYDGQCPICSREVAMLTRRNGEGRLAFEDISDPAFDPLKYGLTLSQVIGSMHAVRSDGTVLSGIDVFAELYDHVGWTWLSRIIRWPVTAGPWHAWGIGCLHLFVRASHALVLNDAQQPRCAPQDDDLARK